jgi:hypothetical protein
VTRADATGRRHFGVLLALAFLARTDAALLTFVTAAWVLPDARRLGAAGVRRMVQLLAAPAITSAVYVAANLWAFDRPMQISGDIKRVDLTLGVALTAVALGLVAVAIGVRLRRLPPSDRFPRTTTFLAETGWYVVFCIGIVTYYTVLSEQQWLWYFAPLALYGLALLLNGAADLVEAAAADGPRSARAVPAIVLVPLVAGFIVLGGQFVDPGLRGIQEANRDAGRWISAELPDDAVVASWDAGVLGAFTDQPVVNLDGVVNSSEFADAMAAGRGSEFLRAEGVTHVANHGSLVDGDDPVARRLVDEIFGPAVGAQMTLVYLEPFVYSGSTTRGTGGPMAMFVFALPQA